MFKKTIKFMFSICLTTYTAQASNQDFLMSHSKLVLNKLIEYLDIQSLGRMKQLSKTSQIKFESLKDLYGEKYSILNIKNLKMLETSIFDFKNLNKENKNSISPFAFSTYLIEITSQNNYFNDFMLEFIRTLVENQKCILIEWQSMMIRKKILKPFFIEIIKKEENQKWCSIYEKEIFANEIYLETRHPYYILPFVFFKDQNISVNYGIQKTSFYYGVTPIELAAIAGFYKLAVFLLKNGAKVNRFDARDSSLFLAVCAYIALNSKSKNCDDISKTIILLVTYGADKDHYIPDEEMTIREYIQRNIFSPDILKLF